MLTPGPEGMGGAIRKATELAKKTATLYHNSLKMKQTQKFTVKQLGLKLLKQ